MGTARLTAYGATAKGSGFASSDDACSTNTGGTQLLATDNGAVYAFAENTDEDSRIYLAKVSSPADPSGLYLDSDGFDSDQFIYVPAQTIGGDFGSITAGYYAIGIDGHMGSAAYFTVYDDEESLVPPTECPEVDPWTAESTPTQPQYSADFTVNNFDNMTVQYKRKITQIPFCRGSNTVATLRNRSSAYKVTTD